MSESYVKNDARYLLRRYLSRFYRAKQKQITLRSRKIRLLAELRAAERDTPSESTEAKEDRAKREQALADIESRIERQLGAATQSVTEIMSVLDLLPADSLERDILELRHIDCLSWDDITKRVHMTRTPCYLKYTRGLDLLLEREEVKQVISDHASALADKRGERSEKGKS